MKFNKVNIDGNNNLVFQDVSKSVFILSSKSDLDIRQFIDSNINNIDEIKILLESELQKGSNDEILLKILETVNKLLKDTGINQQYTDFKNNFSFQQNEHFTGRDEILKKIDETFKTRQSIALTQILEGLGGVGKSEIAKQYAFLHSNEYDCMWWIDAEKETSIIGAYTDFAYKKGLIKQKAETEIVIETVKNWMQHPNNNKWLFIFDNAEKESALEKYLPTQSLKDNQHILITTRYTKFTYPQGIRAKSIPIDVFSDIEATDFLTKWTKLPKNKYSEKLAYELGYLALALEHAAAYILEQELSYKQYFDLYKQKQIEVLKYSIDDKLKPVYITWDISINKLGKEEESATRQLFNLCTFFAPDNIRDNWFVKAIDVLPLLLQENTKDEIKFNEVKAELKKYSLVKITNSDNGDYKKISIHRLLQSVVRDTLKDMQKELVEICVKIMNKQIYDDFSTKQQRADFTDMITHIVSITEQYKRKTEEIANLHFFLGLGFNEQGDYNRGQECFRTTLSIQDIILKRYHPQTARTCNCIGVGFFRMGKYKDALNWYFESLDIRKKTLPPIHKDIAISYNNIGLIYSITENYLEALKWYEQSVKILDKLESEYSLAANSYNNMGFAYCSIDMYDDSLSCFQKAECIYKKYPNDKGLRIRMASTYEGRGSVSLKLKNYTEAHRWFDESLKIREDVLDKEHPFTATIYYHKGDVYLEEKDYTSAFIWYQKALSVRLKRLTKEHPDTKNVIDKLKMIYPKINNNISFDEWLKEQKHKKR